MPKASRIMNIVLFTGVIGTLFLGVAHARQEGVLIKKLIKSPSRYYNTAVIINGKTVRRKSVPAGALSGYYYLQDRANAIIPVATNQLPAKDSILSVKGTVKFNADGPFLAELSRQKAIVTSAGRIVSTREIPFYVLVLAVLGILCVLVAMVFVWFINKRSGDNGPETGLDQVYCNSCQSTFSANQDFIVCPNCGSELTPLTGGILAMGRKKIRKQTMELSNAYFEIMNGSQKGDIYRLNIASDQLNVGRTGGENDFELDDDTVSREHAKVVYKEDIFYIADRGSKNGTYIYKKQKDGSRSKKIFVRREEMNDGDQVQLGETILLFRREK